MEKLPVADEYILTDTSAPEFGVVVLNQIDPEAASCSAVLNNGLSVCADCWNIAVDPIAEYQAAEPICTQALPDVL